MRSASGRKVGCDWVIPDGDDVIVVAPRMMRDWKATKFRKTAVVFEGRTYFVADYEPPAGWRVNPPRGVGHRYRLTPWPEDLHDRPSHTFDYDAPHVGEREREHRVAVNLFGLYLVLVPFYPLLGFLPSRVKAFLERRFALSA